MGHDKRSQQRVIVGAVVALALLGVVVAVLDWREVRGIIGQTDWVSVPDALGFTTISCACLSYGFAVVNRIFGVGMGHRHLLEIGFVSITLNHLP